MAVNETASAYSSGQIEARSNTGDVHIGLHSGGATATSIKHTRGGSGISVVATNGTTLVDINCKTQAQGTNTTQVATTAFVIATVGVANSAIVKTALNAGGTAPIYACRAWVNFNGTGTVAIRASGNVSSITDNGTGDYTVNFITAMPDTKYSVSGFSRGVTSNGNVTISSRHTDVYTTSRFRFSSAYNANAIRYDTSILCIQIHR